MRKNKILKTNESVLLHLQVTSSCNKKILKVRSYEYLIII